MANQAYRGSQSVTTTSTCRPNEEPTLAWRDTTGLVIIRTLGTHLDVLSRLPWIRHDRCWYLGDLDRYDQPDPTLTLAEGCALAPLQLTEAKYLRTEQERIPVRDAEHAVKRARNHPQLLAWKSAAAHSARLTTFSSPLDKDVAAKGAILTVGLAEWMVEVPSCNLLHTRISRR
jgi:hypothetical protein